jgi:hypothetical protein
VKEQLVAYFTGEVGSSDLLAGIVALTTAIVLDLFATRRAERYVEICDGC